MLNEFLNLPGVVVLGKEEQRKVSGGGICRITHSLNGFERTDEAYFEGDSADANAFCVDLITAGHASSCGYDCAYDGYGQ